MTSKELNKYFKDIGLKITCRYYKRDVKGNIVSDKNGDPIHDTIQVTSSYIDTDEGWYQLIHDLIAELIKTNWDRKIIGVKEKFGGLRFQLNASTNEMFGIIRKYEELSYETCEVCGEKGILRDDCGSNGSRWYKTMCDKHYKELKTKRNQY